MNARFLLPCVLLFLPYLCQTEASFRFFKSLWRSNSTTTTTAAPIMASTATLPTTSTTVAPLPNFAVYLARYPHLNESYLAELALGKHNTTEDVERFEANDSIYHNRPSEDMLEVEEPVESNVTLPPNTFEIGPNISSYFEMSHNENKPAEEDEKPFEVLINNDKTMAHLKFDQSGRNLDSCALYDIEKDETVLKSVPLATGLRPPLTADYKTMLEAIRRCTELARRQLEATPGNVLATAAPTNETTTEAPKVSGTNTSLAIAGFVPASTVINVTGSAGSSASNSHKNEVGFANFISVWKGIMPGTKWCGLGDSALDYHDLGSKADIDLCCRAHDHCPIRLKAFRMGYGLINFSFYTKSHCDCDDDFFKCLKQSSNSYSQMLKNFYFNVLKVYCIKHESPLVCIKKRKINNLRKEECIQYEVSNSTKMKFVPFESH